MTYIEKLLFNLSIKILTWCVERVHKRYGAGYLHNMAGTPVMDQEGKGYRLCWIFKQLSSKKPLNYRYEDEGLWDPWNDNED